MGKLKSRLEFLLLLSLIIFGVACLLSESGAQALTISEEGFTVSFYTNLISFILIGICLLRVVFLLMEVRHISNGEHIHVNAVKENIISIGLTMGLAIFFVFGMRNIGFYISTFLTLFIMYMAFEKWNKKEIIKSIIFSVGVCIVFVIVFNYLKVFLPNAPLF
jgi:hypothetical protein